MFTFLFGISVSKGAERKTRDEERRAAKRKIVVTGRNKRLEELYHLHAERSEFYHMADLVKPPALFTPDDHEKVSPYSVNSEISYILISLQIDASYQQATNLFDQCNDAFSDIYRANDFFQIN